MVRSDDCRGLGEVREGLPYGLAVSSEVHVTETKSGDVSVLLPALRMARAPAGPSNRDDRASGDSTAAVGVLKAGHGETLRESRRGVTGREGGPEGRPRGLAWPVSQADNCRVCTHSA